MAIRRKILIHLFIDNVDYQQVETIRTKIENFLVSEPDAALLRFEYTEEETNQ